MDMDKGIKDQRHEARTAASLEGAVRVDGEIFPCRLRNISFKGAQISSDRPIVKGTRIILLLEPFGSVSGEVVWHAENAAGILFDDSAETIESIVMGLASFAAS